MFIRLFGIFGHNKLLTILEILQQSMIGITTIQQSYVFLRRLNSKKYTENTEIFTNFVETQYGSNRATNWKGVIVDFPFFQT